MREILFRGKANDKWIYGYFIQALDMDNTPKKSCIIENMSNFSVVDGKLKQDYYAVSLETIGQYTGLTDKNGTKIFEGDIVKVNNKYIDIVIYASGCFCMDRQIINYEFTYQDSKSLEVIGNIYDNPGLVEKVVEDDN